MIIHISRWFLNITPPKRETILDHQWCSIGEAAGAVTHGTTFRETEKMTPAPSWVCWEPPPDWSFAAIQGYLCWGLLPPPTLPVRPIPGVPLQQLILTLPGTTRSSLFQYSSNAAYPQDPSGPAYFGTLLVRPVPHWSLSMQEWRPHEGGCADQDRWWKYGGCWWFSWRGLPGSCWVVGSQKNTEERTWSSIWWRPWRGQEDPLIYTIQCVCGEYE